MLLMAKKKPTGGKHTTPRRPIQMPADWHAIVKKIAVQQRRPAMWVLIEMVKAKAEEMGIPDLPPGPWEDASPAPGE